MSNIVNPNSIRQTVITMLLAGADTKSIAASVQEKFPQSAAAAKSTKHIAWYRADLKKRGLLPVAGVETAPAAE